MQVAILIALVSLAYVVINVLFVLVRNYRAHQFFTKRAPDLPQLPNPNIFHGHLCNVIMQHKNWSLIDKLHEDYGPNFGLYHTHQPWVLTKDLDLIKKIELDEPALHLNRGDLGVPFKQFSKSVIQTNGDTWRRQRRAIAQALTNRKVRSMSVTEDLRAILNLVKDGIDFKMAENNDGRSLVLDVGDMFLRYSLKVVHTIILGIGIKVNFRSKRDLWTSNSNLLTKTLPHPIVTAAMIFPFVRSIFEFLMQFHGMTRVSDKISEKIVSRMATNVYGTTTMGSSEESNSNGLIVGNEQTDQWQSQSTRNKPDSDLSDLNAKAKNNYQMLDTMITSLKARQIKQNELIDGMFALLAAGFQTTGDTITCLVWQLAKEPHIQERLRQSILVEGIDSKYLGWCIQEAIRIHPAVPLGVGRLLGTDVTVNSVFVPKGTYVVPSIYSIHHDPNVWPEPEVFKPERWRDTSGQHPAAFMGFGLGARNCLGAKMALHEIKLAIELMLTNYSIEKCSETVNEYAFSSPMLVYTNPDEPIKVRLVALDKHQSKGYN